MTKISLTLIIVGAVVSPLSVQAADQVFCEDYAREMINIPQPRKDLQKICNKNQSHWNTDKASHIKWCKSASEVEANKKRYNHNNLVNVCNDSYKLIMIDRKRVASLPISSNDEMQMDIAPKGLKKALVSGNITNSYSKLFPEIDAAIKNGSLKGCTFNSLSVEMDKNPKTKEWVVSSDEQCIEGKPFGHIWLIQQANDQYRILFEGEHHTINLRVSESNNYRNISISSQLTPQQETKQRCGSIDADWHYVEGRYIPFQGTANEMGSCLPEYTLPDYLQGANTYDLAEGEWEKGMAAEEIKRKALMAPYKKALQDYVPEWIASVEKSIPANAIAIDTPKALATSDNNESSKTSSASSKGKSETGEKGKKGDDESINEDKTFIENMRVFLGLD